MLGTVTSQFSWTLYPGYSIDTSAVSAQKLVSGWRYLVMRGSVNPTHSSAFLHEKSNLSEKAEGGFSKY